MSLFGPVISILYAVVPFILVMSVVVFFHELGHFLVGRWCGAKVDAFSIGFGPELLARVDRHGTRWRIAAVPLGGYVKFHGDMNAASAGISDAVAAMPEAERMSTFAARPVYQRAAIVSAGPIANFLLAILVFSAVFYAEGQPSQDARIGAVNAGSAAARAGLEPGDVVTSIDGKPVTSFKDMHDIVFASPGVPLHITVQRAGHEIDVPAMPDSQENQGPSAPHVGLLGVQVAMEPISASRSVIEGAQACWAVVSGTAHYVGGLIMGREKADQFSGPIGIASVTSQAARTGFGTVLKILALISISIGFINLMPIPLLDGGHLLYFAVEALRGRPMSLGAQEFGFKVGLALVSMLMIFATYNDIFKHSHG